MKQAQTHINKHNCTVIHAFSIKRYVRLEKRIVNTKSTHSTCTDYILYIIGEESEPTL